MLTSSADNIRFNGTGRAYAAEVGGSSFDDLGEMENVAFGIAVSTEKVNSTRNAARGVILEVESERNATMQIGLRELSEENMKMILLGSAINTDNQAAGTVDADVVGTDITLVADKYVDLGKLNVFSTKLTGVITGTIAVGDTITGVTSTAHGKIAYKSSTTVELVAVSGTFQVGETVQLSSGNNIVPSSIEILEDVVVTNAAGSTRRVQGTDYTLDPDSGMIRQLSTGGIVATDEISYDYEAVNRKYIHGMSAGTTTKKIVFVSDKDDQGVRFRITWHKVNLFLNGDFPLMGTGMAIPALTGSVLYDATQPSGQEYFKVEMM
jgi:hypothetical protein